MSLRQGRRQRFICRSPAGRIDASQSNHERSRVSVQHPEQAVDALIDLFEQHGRLRYGDGITQEEHALQSAKQAIDEDAPPALVAAALLHDVGHLLVERDRVPTVDLRHEAVGARALARWFGPDVTNPIALHVDAKRYLCAPSTPTTSASCHQAPFTPSSYRAVR